MKYAPHTDQDVRQMLDFIGLSAIGDLFDQIPEEIKQQADINCLGTPRAEWILEGETRELAGRNISCTNLTCYRGAGAYDHWVPSVIRAITSRAEFLTSYTPYQAEISQGLLQSIYEYQSMICNLTGMDVTNASMYDGPTALAEAALMSCEATGRSEIVASCNLDPRFMRVLRTYGENCGYSICVTNGNGMKETPSEVLQFLSSETAAVVLQNPNYWGVIEEPGEIFALARTKGALSIAVVDPISLGVMQGPGEYGADIAVGDGQSLGNEMSFGGPSLGILAAKSALIRKMPGRIVGRTTDSKGRPGFVLTLQAREQHIRRAKATSNICSNQALNALAATIYLALVGARGLRQIGVRILAACNYFSKKITELGNGFSINPDLPVFREIVVSSSISPGDIERSLLQRHILSGLPLEPTQERQSLWCLTEKRTNEEIDYLIEQLNLLARGVERC